MTDSTNKSLDVPGLTSLPADPVTTQGGLKLVASVTGATRTEDTNKPDFEGFLSPLVLERFGQYMHTHRKLSDGSLRASDNWQCGIPIANYAKSLVRHVFQVWMLHRGNDSLDYDTGEVIDLDDALCAVMFNVMGWLHERIKSRTTTKRPRGRPRGTSAHKE